MTLIVNQKQCLKRNDFQEIKQPAIPVIDTERIAAVWTVMTQLQGRASVAVNISTRKGKTAIKSDV